MACSAIASIMLVWSVKMTQLVNILAFDWSMSSLHPFLIIKCQHQMLLGVCLCCAGLSAPVKLITLDLFNKTSLMPFSTRGISDTWTIVDSMRIMWTKKFFWWICWTPKTSPMASWDGGFLKVDCSASIEKSSPHQDKTTQDGNICGQLALKWVSAFS